MTIRRDAALGALIVFASLAVVAIRLRSNEADEESAQAAAHVHGAAGGAEGMSSVVLDQEAARRIGVALTAVERRPLELSVSAVGTVAYDETRLVTLNPKIEGWVEALQVDFTGSPVTAGEPLLEVYSPELLTAQEELILAARLAAGAAPGRAAANATQLLESARRKLAYWDIPEDEIARIEVSGEPSKTLTLRAPATGIVVEKNVVQGDRIMPGMTLYRIANLESVWIEADVFEKDVALVAEGQDATVTFEAFPGSTFAGRVSYVYPTVSLQSRTARVRLELPNPARALKPGMYANIVLQVPLGEPTLVVPRSAVIETGQRALVFVRGAEGALDPREVTVGRTSGQLTQILAGLDAGERVVSSAAFLVDAESNLGTMAPSEGAPPPAETGGPATPSTHTGHGS
ncbi:MAG: efflux RND transporter periplasmic adaptor subunit [Gemmatimonadales bacterium]|jgi:Cu(I)/Ag(I) efflux system membrane fusion protein